LASKGFIRKPGLEKYAGFYPDEVEIGPDADEDRIREVLEFFGCESEFDRIREAAYKKYPVDDSFEGPKWMDDVAGKPPPPAALAADIEEIRLSLQTCPRARSTPNWQAMKARFADFK
jgi:hypothetical protein